MELELRLADSFARSHPREAAAALDAKPAGDTARVLQALPAATVDPTAAMRTVDLLLAARADLARNVNVGLVLVDTLTRAEATLHGRRAATA